MTAQNIQFKGIRRTPSDITGQDGDLLDCVNLVHENGELKPIAMPERSGVSVPMDGRNPFTLSHIHNTSSGDMFVFVLNDDEGSKVWIKDSRTYSFRHRIEGETIRWVKSVGETLLVGTDKSIHYVYYKDDEYLWLGDSLPRPVIDFALEYGDVIWTKTPTPTSLIRNDTETMKDGLNLCTKDNDLVINYNHWEYQQNSGNKTSNNFRDNVLSKIAYVTNKAKEKNQFLFPFFVRYAVKLFDNTYTCQSQPILMLPSTYKFPFLVTINAYEYDGSIIHVNGDYREIKCNAYVYGLPSRLKYTIKSFVDADNNVMSDADLENWKDIISGVDIFCSSQMSQINKSVETDDAFSGLKFDGTVFQYPDNPQNKPDMDSLGHTYEGWYNKKEVLRELFSILENPDTEPNLPGNLVHYLELPSQNKTDYTNKLAETNLFHIVKSYKLKRYRKHIEDGDVVFLDGQYEDAVELGTLQSLESSKTLSDDYISRGRIAAETGNVYNKRLILGNIKTEVPLWYPMVERPSGETNSKYYRMCFVIEKNGKVINVLTSLDTMQMSYYRFGHYIYYPDPDCTRVYVYASDTRGEQPQPTPTTPHYYEIEMTKHPYLNGAYAIMPDLWSLGEAIDHNEFDSVDGFPQVSEDRFYTMRNSIAMAEVANPYAMQATNFKEAGNRNVIDVAPNMREVSPGQWGLFQLFVFAEDGIYAFDIKQDGTLGDMSAVSSDVLLKPQGMGRSTLIHTDQTSIFLTNRGVMLLDGSKVQPLSLVLNGRHFNALNDLGSNVAYNSGAFANMITKVSDTVSFHDFMLGGFLAYDYTHNRVLVLNSESVYQYVLSLDTGLWSRQVVYKNLGEIQQEERDARTIDEIKVMAAADNYTEMYLQGDDNRLYATNNVTDENAEDSLYQYGYFVSRPVRFGTDEFKTITRLLHRYTHYGKYSEVKLAIYGSRDGVRYGKVNTLRGMSYRYFIFVVYSYLKPNERYSYMTVDFEPRLVNKLR